MECTRSTFVAILIYCSFQDTVLSQYVVPEDILVREIRECPKLTSNPSSTDMLNSILQTAATNGVLPDLIPMLQGNGIADNLQRFPFSQDILNKPLSVLPMPSYNAQEPIILSGQSIKPASLSGYPSTMIPTTPQTILPLPSSNCLSQIAQALPLENPPNIGAVRPMSIIQSQSQFNEVKPYCYNQIAEPVSLPDINPLNVPVLPSTQNLPNINACSGALDLTSNLAASCLPQPTLCTSDCQPLNLQVSVPTTNLPAPRVTVISASPSNSPISVPVPCYPDYSALPYQYPPQPPIVIEKSSKSSWRKWLPLLLMTLLSDRGCNDGGGCRCCCSCNSSGSNIPIPYPIPIPINCPIINTSSPSASYTPVYGQDFYD